MTGMAIALSAVGIDAVRLADGSAVDRVLGGAGTYTALGLALTAPCPVGVVSGIGQDFPFGPWFSAWGIDTSGLRVTGVHTHVSELVYDADEQRQEWIRDHVDSFARALPVEQDIPDTWRPAAGVAVLGGPEAIGPAFDGGACADAPVVLWELLADAAAPGSWLDVRARLAAVDVFSLNRREAERLLGTGAPDSWTDALLAAGCRRVALRLDASGSLHATASERCVVPAAETLLVDPTGGGNTFCGALLGAILSGLDLHGAAIAASAAASVALDQFGPPGIEARTRVRDRTGALAARGRSEHRESGIAP